MSKDNGGPVFPGDVAPNREGVYIVTTDSACHYGFFLGYFNGQYWYEHTRADHFYNPKRVPRKKPARLAVTAWMRIGSGAFTEALREDRKAPVDLSGRQGQMTEKQYLEKGRAK